MNNKIRKTVPLVGAFALTASALLAGSGAALAGKADPTADLSSISGCRGSSVTASFEIDAKGRWVYLEAKLFVDGELVEELPWGKHNKNTVEMRHYGTVSNGATAKLWFGDRKSGRQDAPAFDGKVC